MEILVISDNKKLKELLSFQITSQLPVTVKECSPKAASEWLHESPSRFAVAVLPYSGSDSNLLVSLKAHNPELPVIFYFDPLISDPDPEDFQGVHLVGTVEVSSLVAGTIDLIKGIINEAGIQTDPLLYCPIRTSLLIQVSPVLSDIFIRLSLTKFVKIFNSGDDFDETDLAKYAGKQVEYLYLPRDKADAFVSKFQNELDAMLAKTDLSPDKAMDLVVNTQETLAQLIQHVGFTEEVQQIAKKNVQLALKAIGKNPKLNSLLTRVREGKNYIAEHSALLAEVACCVAKEVQWGSDATFGKLVLAAFMHDISVTDPDLCKINDLNELQNRKDRILTKEMASYHLHPLKSADVVRSFKEIPPDVDIIVAQHHELPNGKGFPRGLSGVHIAPLAVVFIVSHEITREILEKREKFSLADFLKERGAIFESGNFKKIFSALGKTNFENWNPQE